MEISPVTKISDNLVKLIDQSMAPYYKTDETTGKSVVKRSDLTTPEQLQKTADNGHLYQVLDNNTRELLGCFTLSPDREEPETNVYFGMLAVWPSMQNRGLASKIMQQAEDLARSQNFKSMKLILFNLPDHQLCDKIWHFYHNKLNYVEVERNKLADSQGVADYVGILTTREDSPFFGRDKKEIVLCVFAQNFDIVRMIKNL